VYCEISVEEALKRTDVAYIDLRSPDEFAQTSIPGALNIPLFDDDQRRELGVIYHTFGEEKARRTALQLVSPKLPALVDEIERAAGENIPLLYCWRGGLRSLSVYQIMHLAGAPVLRLKGGYRAYRRYVNRRLNDYRLNSKMLVLHGLTGVGKTAIIGELLRRGLPVLDLEGAVRHRGSVFGAVGLKPQRSQKDFDALLLGQLERFNGEPLIAVEGEGGRIGNVHLPPFLTQAMAEGHRLLITAPLAERVRRIVEEYLPAEPSAIDLEQIRQAVHSLRRRLGAERTEKLYFLLDQGKFAAAAEILCLEYYDRMYGEARAEKEHYFAVIDSTDVGEAMDQVSSLLQYYALPAEPLGSPT
jgi:tRNA 2-selenouridine synthase